MLGKRSRPLLHPSFKVSSSHVQDSAANAPVCSKHPFVPQHVKIGFDIRQEIKPCDVCESPRSVLDVNVHALEKHPLGRSFRSYVRALPLRQRGSQGVGLAIIVDIHAEEKEEDPGSLPPAGHSSAAIREQNHHHGLDATSIGLQNHCHLHQQQSQPITIARNSCSQKERPYNKMGKYVQSFGSDTDVSSAAGSARDIEFFSLDYPSPEKENAMHGRMRCNERDIVRPSIFTVASIPSDYGIESLSLLDACALCQRAFAPGKDIFMYRGDQAFCSVECRGERIKIDEYKEKLFSLYS